MKRERGSCDSTPRSLASDNGSGDGGGMGEALVRRDPLKVCSPHSTRYKPHATMHKAQSTKLHFHSTTLNRIRPSTSLDSPLKTSAKVTTLCHHFVYVVAVMFYLFFHIAHDKSHITRHNPLAAPLSQPHCSVQTGFTVARIVLRLPNQR